MEVLVGAFNQEKALIGAFSVIVQPVVELMEHYTALVQGLRPRHLYLICFMCGKDHHLSKIFDLLTMILYVRKYLIAKETLYVPTNILNSQRHVLLLQLTQLK